MEELTRDSYNNQNNNDFKIVINERTYDSKNEKIFWMEATTPESNKYEAKELKQKDIDALEREKIDEPEKKYILTTLENIMS